MLALSPLHRQRLQDVVNGVLHSAVADGTLCHDSDPTRNYECDPTAAVAAAVRFTVETVVSQFLEARNARNNDLLMRLPPELATACFRMLPFRGRVAVSHVSRAWRRTALADCCLWSSLTLYEGGSGGSKLLSALLARSGGVPFDFEWDSSDPVPDAVLDVVIQNMDRMGSLICRGYGDAARALLEHKAPELQCLRLANTDVTLRADWGAQWAPRLEVLVLDGLRIPEDLQPLAALTYLSARFTWGSSTPVLAQVFPRLVTLRLGGVTRAAVEALGAPPPSCRSVTLISTHRGTVRVDYQPFLLACHSHRLPYLSVSGADAISPYVREFMDSTSGNCCLSFEGEIRMNLECKEDGVIRRVYAAESDRLPIPEEASCFLYLDRLGELSLPLELLFDLYTLQPPGATFPALRSLDLMIDPQTAQVPQSLADGKGGPLRMPLLDDLTLTSHSLAITDPAPAYWLTVEVPRLLPKLIVCSNGRLCLTSLTLVMPFLDNRTDSVDGKDLGSLRGLAETFRVVDWSPFSDTDGWTGS